MRHGRSMGGRRSMDDQSVVRALSVHPGHLDREGYEWVQRGALARSRDASAPDTFLLNRLSQEHILTEAPASVRAIVAAAEARDCWWIIIDPEEEETIEGVRTYSWEEYKSGKNHDA